MNKGKLHLKSTGEFIKECSQDEYIELAMATPNEYIFHPYSKPSPTIHDLNDFANRSMQKSNIDNNAKNKHIFFNIKSISHWAAAAGIIATVIAIWEYVIKPFISKK